MSSAWEIGRFPSKCGVGYSSGVMLRLLCLFTGAATAIPVVWALGWAVWGAPCQHYRICFASRFADSCCVSGGQFLEAHLRSPSGAHRNSSRLVLLHAGHCGFRFDPGERSGTRPRCPPVDSLNFAARSFSSQRRSLSSRVRGCLRGTFSKLRLQASLASSRFTLRTTVMEAAKKPRHHHHAKARFWWRRSIPGYQVSLPFQGSRRTAAAQV